VPAHAEAQWLLSAVASFGELRRMTQFKDKADAQEFVSAALFTYPVLMAADVLAYRAHEVPVGEDQREHIELMRDVAEAFNKRFGETLVVPEGNIPTVGARVRDLQEPEKKMSTTGGTPKGTVYVDEEPAGIIKKFKSAQTDSGNEIRCADDKPGISNLIEILAVARDCAPADIEREYAGQTMYGPFKQAVGEEVAAWLAPTRERYAEIKDDTAYIEGVLEVGAEKARAITSVVLADVREAMGVGPVRTHA
jgi:tryptophanyl-tRNA synthetase